LWTSKEVYETSHDHYLAKADAEEPAARTEGGDDERHAQQEADVCGRQTGNVAVADCSTRLVPITNNHQQHEAVSYQTWEQMEEHGMQRTTYNLC